MRMDVVRREGATALPHFDDEGQIASRGIAHGLVLGGLCWAAIILAIF